MLYSIKNPEESEIFNKLISLQSQVNGVRLQDKLGEQNYQQNTKNFIQPMTDAIKDTSENLTKTITETFKKTNKAIEKLNENVLVLMIEKVMIAPYLVFSLINLFKPENERQYKLTQDRICVRMNDFLINGGIPIALYSNTLTFRDSSKSFILNGDLLETMTCYDFNVSRSNPKDQKLI